jgi:hypothetical protein
VGWGSNKTETNKSEYPNANASGTGTGATGTVVQETPIAPPSASQNGWKKVEQKADGTFFKFERDGEELVGTWQGTYNGGKNKWGRDNINGKIVTPEGIALVTMNENLTRQLGNVDAGKRVKIIYKGKKFNAKSGNYFKDYEVFVEE